MFLEILTKYRYIRRLTFNMRKCDFGAIGLFFRLDGSGSKRHLIKAQVTFVEYCFARGRVCWSYLTYPGFLTYTLSCTIVGGLRKLQRNLKENKDDYSEQKNKTQLQQEWQHSIVGRTELLGSATH